MTIPAGLALFWKSELSSVLRRGLSQATQDKDFRIVDDPVGRPGSAIVHVDDVEEERDQTLSLSVVRAC